MILKLNTFLYTGDFAFPKKHEDNFVISRNFSCKEAFSRRFGRFTKHIAIKSYKYDIPHKFLDDIETKLKLNPKQKLQFILYKDNLLVIKVSRWWRHNGIRREFLLTSLRAASKSYNDYDFDNILKRDYLGRNPRAVKKFLKGYTCYFGLIQGTHGWEATFHRKRNRKRMFRPLFCLTNFHKLLDY